MGEAKRSMSASSCNISFWHQHTNLSRQTLAYIGRILTVKNDNDPEFVQSGQRTVRQYDFLQLFDDVTSMCRAEQPITAFLS
jgi:hypothetical protein